MIIKIVEDSISLDELREIAKEYYIDMIKGVADISKEIIAVGGEYHMDANMKILEHGSVQANVWGFNIFIDRPRDERIEFTSLINIRPLAGNRSMEVENEEIREKMRDIINRKII
jgi:shikimate kinase